MLLSDKHDCIQQDEGENKSKELTTLHKCSDDASETFSELPQTSESERDTIRMVK